MARKKKKRSEIRKEAYDRGKEDGKWEMYRLLKSGGTPPLMWVMAREYLDGLCQQINEALGLGTEKNT